ncbi:MAG: hypothetical protein K6E47_14340 [Lachnospiraceae bacterium]|nr:hypothetical protein [Lachnospiraceae bacterium]
MGKEKFYELEEDMYEDDEVLGSGVGDYVPPSIASDEMIKKDVIARLTRITEPSWFYADLTWQLVIGILLVFFRFLTAEMIMKLFPGCSGFELSILKGKLEKKSHKYITTTTYDGLKAAYSLTQDGFDYFRSLIPPEILKAARIPIGIGTINKDVLRHDVDLRMVLCAYLLSGNKSSPRWYTSLYLQNGKTPMECIKEAIQNDKSVIKAQNNAKIKADAIIAFGEGITIVEQDTGTEHGPVMKDKIIKYSEYFTSLRSHDYQLMINVCVHNEVKERTRSNSNALKNIKELMRDEAYTALTDAYRELSILLQKDPKRKKYKNMYMLLKAFFVDGSFKGDDIRTLSRYVEAQKPVSNIHANRAARIKQIIHSVYIQNENLKNAINNGLSISVTSNICRQAYYINPYESGLLDELLKIVKSECIYGIDVTKHRVATIRGHICRNVISLSQKGITIGRYIVSEISSDIAEYIRITEFIKECRGYGDTIYLLLVVASTEDAVLFCEETGCVRDFCSKDNIAKPNPDRNITVRFMQYSETGVGMGKMFIPRGDGSTMEIKDL